MTFNSNPLNYEKNLTTGNVTSYYYLGDTLVAMSENATLRYIHQDPLLFGKAKITNEEHIYQIFTMTQLLIFKDKHEK